MADKRAIDVKFNHDTNEIILLIKYRYEYGDPIEADVDHILSLDQASKLTTILLNVLDRFLDKSIVHKTLDVTNIYYEGGGRGKKD